LIINPSCDGSHVTKPKPLCAVVAMDYTLSIPTTITTQL